MTVYGFDVEGLGYANCVSGFINLIFTLIYTHCVPSISEAVAWPNSSTLEGLTAYVKLGLPIVIIMCSDWWAYSIIMIISGRLGVSDQAAFVIIQCIDA